LKAGIPAACRTCLTAQTACTSRTPNAADVESLGDDQQSTPCCPLGDASCGNKPSQGVDWPTDRYGGSTGPANYEVSCQYVTGGVGGIKFSSDMANTCQESDVSTVSGVSTLNPNYGMYRCYKGVDQCSNVTEYGCQAWKGAVDYDYILTMGMMSLNAMGCFQSAGNQTACTAGQSGVICMWDASQPAWNTCTVKPQFVAYVAAMKAQDLLCQGKTDNATCLAVAPAGTCQYIDDGYSFNDQGCTSDSPTAAVQAALQKAAHAPSVKIQQPSAASGDDGSSSTSPIIVVVVIVIALAIGGVAFMAVKKVGPFAPKAAKGGLNDSERQPYS
jgi:hypothetical protein